MTFGRRGAVGASGPAGGQEQSTLAVDRNTHRASAGVAWRLPLADGRCNLSAATASFEATVLLPRLAADRPPAPDLQAAWTRYIGALRLHEAGHLRRAHDRLDDVAIAVRSSSCATANAAGERILNEIRRDQAQYDAATQHGRTQGAMLR